MKSVVSIVISICLFIGFFSPMTVYASDMDFYADALNVLGLFKGTEKGYELDRVITGAETAVMLVRLLGKEKEALSLNLSHLFTDVPVWANQYIGYLYQKGLTKGIGDNLFGSNLLTTPVRYAVFLLRALGYTEEDGDFVYENALDKLCDIGVLERSEAEDIGKDKKLSRGETVFLSYKALWSLVKGGGDRLADRLIESGAIKESCVNALGKPRFPSDVSKLNDRYVIKTPEQLSHLIRWAMFSGKERLLIDPTGYQGDIHQDASDALKRQNSFSGLYNGADFKWLSDVTGNVVRYEISIRYTVTPSEREELLTFACGETADLIRPEMTDAQKELAIHDYIVNRTVYGYSDHAYDAYGALILKEAVCQGYSRALLLMLSLTGIECMEVVGSDEGTGHSWNIVKLDGEYYHVDAAFDDPVGDKNVLRHYYFNVTDQDLVGHREWNRSDYPACTGEQYNYYKMTGEIVKNRDELIKRIASGFSQGKRYFEIRLSEYNKEDYTKEGMRTMIQELSGKINGVIQSYSWVTYDRMGVVQIMLK